MSYPAENLRATDAQRQAIADIVNEAFADGRLDISEHSERLSAVWAAKTIGELTPLVADLQMAPPVLPGQGPYPAQYPAPQQGGWMPDDARPGNQGFSGGHLAAAAAAGFGLSSIMGGLFGSADSPFDFF